MPFEYGSQQVDIPNPFRFEGMAYAARAGVLIVLGLLALLLLGISIGRALEDGPNPGGTVTNVRTLNPQPLPPAARTVTVTVTGG